MNEDAINDAWRIHNHWKLQVEADAKAAEAGRRFQKQNEYLNQYIANNKYNESQARSLKQNNYGLIDAMDDWGFWKEESLRHHNAIQTEYTARVILGLTLPGEEPSVQRQDYHIPAQPGEVHNRSQAR